MTRIYPSSASFLRRPAKSSLTRCGEELPPIMIVHPTFSHCTLIGRKRGEASTHPSKNVSPEYSIWTSQSNHRLSSFGQIMRSRCEYMVNRESPVRPSSLVVIVEECETPLGETGGGIW